MSQVCVVTATGEYVCGTGLWNGPKPGDPNTSDILITAVPAYGGIDVNWTWPDTYPEAVAYTTIYRGTTPDFMAATTHVAAAAGNFFYDKTTNEFPTAYYYWILLTSIYGTKSELIGPATTVAKPRIDQMLEDLTGKIDNGVLAPALKNDIARIELNALGITQEILARQSEDEALGAQVNVVGAHSDETRALLQEEVLARTTQGSAFVSTVNTLWAETSSGLASIQVQQTALSNEVQAMAEQLTRLETQVGEDLAQVLQTMQTKIDVVDGKVVAIGALYTAQVNVNGLIGGFGVYNDGTTVEAGFDVDRFWVGRTNGNKRKPFIIENDIVYIDDAAIRQLTFSKLRDESGSFIVENGKIRADYLQVDSLIVNQAQSLNYVAGVSGWVLRANGDLEFNGPAAGGGRLTMTNRLIQVFDSNNVLRVRLGIWG
ncbi:tail fiber protein [Pseudomonas phage phCDa]|uniref:Tail fiber protein n=1 Tax=Pseudomonas phage phCDa TaxID=2268587 RepID=A0A2Z5HA01_9CAUD|nr:tail fiber protein [Pseudomonas phage phCDa]AXC36537.1 tail fiber protein [Pseudomonas phage phCDa]